MRLVASSYVVGRADGCHIRLTDRNVSREHALLRKSAQTYVLEDLDSFNGTLVNGLRVTEPVPLVGGDIIQIADYAMLFEDEATPVPPNPERAETRNARVDRLVVISGDETGNEYPLDSVEVRVGREEGSHVTLDDGTVSRRHCRLVRLQQGRFDVFDEGSSHGTRINGQTLRRGVIEPGDTLQVGNVVLRYVAAGDSFRLPLHGGGSRSARGRETFPT